MVSLLPVMLLGFFLGMRHASDPDHVLAVSTIVGRERSIRLAALLGSLWGLGHTATIVVVGALIAFCNLTIPPRLGLGMEFGVALMLVLLGAISVTHALRGVRVGRDGRPLPSHPHQHGDYVHEHAHGLQPNEHGHDEADTPAARLDRRFGHLGFYRSLRPVLIGTVHGLAGSAGVALLVVPTMRTPLSALGYLLVFGVGTIAGMVLITAAVAVPFAYTARRADGYNRALRLIAGIMSVCFGAFLVYQLGFVDGLFAGAPRWMPQ